MLPWQINHLYKIHALHGFLGSPEDWLSLGFLKHENFFAHHLFTDFPIQPFLSWAERFNQSVSAGIIPSNNILMGYSLGGRLGLHALLQNPDNWKAAIFISTHPGLKSFETRRLRIAADEKWAERFEKEAWHSLMQAWNTQPVFTSDSFEFKRQESTHNRQMLSLALDVWSLGNQKDLSAELADLEQPVLWMVGSCDIELMNQARQLRFKHSKSKLCILSGAGHRAPWEQPQNFLLNATQFIQNLEY